MENYKKFDTIVGRVIGYTNKGCLVRDEKTDKVVFCFASCSKGDRVQLSVKRVNREREQVTCLLDSVLEYAPFRYDYAA